MLHQNREPALTIDLVTTGYALIRLVNSAADMGSCKEDTVKKKMTLKTETMKLLSGNDLKVVAGGGIHGTGTETGLCPAHSVNCVKTR